MENDLRRSGIPRPWWSNPRVASRPPRSPVARCCH